MGRHVSLLGLLAVVCATSLTATLPKVVPKMLDTSPDFSTLVKAVWASTAPALSAPVNATELDTLTDPGTTWVIVTLTTALIWARMFASSVTINCTYTHTSYV